MDRNAYAPDFKDLPGTLPIFPLAGVLLLPGGNLPLNIFEPRYLAMVEDAMGTNRMIGMIQPNEKNVKNITDATSLYKTGCAGKITEFSETADGRYLIKLSGIARFDVAEEISGNRGYRRVKPRWNGYEKDLIPSSCLGVDRARLKDLLQKYFEHEGMTCDWGAVDGTPDGKLMTCLSMVCPFDAAEKQALLEAKGCGERAKMFMAMLEMAVSGDKCACPH
jgi:Lon protease-like protein